MDNLFELIAKLGEQFVSYLPRIAAALLVLAAAYFLGVQAAKLGAALLRRVSARGLNEAFLRAITVAVAVFFGLIIALNILGLSEIAASLLAGGGVTAIVLGFAFREIGENFLAGVFLAFSRPFKLGDLIKSEDIEGHVKDIELRYTHLRTEDGRDIYVPSSQLFSKPVTNFTKDGLRRFSFTVGIDYADSALDACALLAATCKSVPGVLPTPTSAASISALLPQYVELRVFFWIDFLDKTQDVLAVQTAVMDSCRRALLEGSYTVSSNTTSNIAIASDGTLESDGR